jgi:tetratricopeptide (TPR) repeat protein/predicted aspartyl protease
MARARLRRAALGALLVTMAAAGARAQCKLETFANLAVTMIRLQPVITAKINGADARFIIDSGAFYSTISPAMVARYGLRTGPGLVDELVGVGGSTKASMTKVAEFTLAGQTVKNVPFLVARDLMSGEFAGALGQNLLAIGDVDYDLGNGAIRLMRPSGCEHSLLAYWANAGEPFGSMEISQDPQDFKLTTGTVEVNGTKFKALFDTGTGVSNLTLSAARRLGISSESMIPAGEVGGTGGGRVRTWIAPISTFEVGGEKIEHTHLRIADYSRIGDFDMLIGADFFASHRVYVANSQHKLYFTYNGGPVFNLESAPQSGSAPAQTAVAKDLDASGFARRGAAFASRRQYSEAVADLSRAIELAPKESAYLYQRGEARLGLGQTVLAMADFNAAIALTPEDAAAHMARARLLVAGPDKALAIQDLDAADKVLAKQADERLGLAALYERADAFPAAIGQYDLWIDAHRTDTRLPGGLNGRCWTKALAGVDLAGALADCNGALRRMPKSPDFLDSRGLVHLRMGDPDKAIADYDLGLAAAPKLAWSLYGRGLARLKKGQTAQGQADIAAATAIDPHLPATAKRYGLTP